jgi:hypothetical protein
MDAPILISPHWDIEFHVHTFFNLAVRVVLVQNLTRKCNQPIVYASQLVNNGTKEKISFESFMFFFNTRQIYIVKVKTKLGGIAFKI